MYWHSRCSGNAHKGYDITLVVNTAQEKHFYLSSAHRMPIPKAMLGFYHENFVNVDYYDHE